MGFGTRPEPHCPDCRLKERSAYRTVSVADFVPPENAAVTVAVRARFSRFVVTRKVACEAPAATVTLTGTVTVRWLLESATVRPPAGAGALRLTVPVVAVPPRTLFGLIALVYGVVLRYDPEARRPRKGEGEG